MVRRADGSSTVELAIVFPILLLLFIASAELGRLFYTYTTLAKATKVGARYISTSRDAISGDAAKVAAATLQAQSLVVCGYTNCSGNQPDGTPKVPIVAGLDMNNPAANVAVTLFTQIEGTVTVRYVKVQIQGYSYSPGAFNLASRIGAANSTFYFALTPSITMRYMR
ncbi:MAG TPA: TadE/TadG family type IV pilus assembly protein [Pyrinomonadaceae bacterium]